jgi:GxxExxY protein
LGLQARTEVAIPVDYHGVRVGDYRADIIVESQLILELKAVASLNIRHEAQLVNYLAATGIDDGILFNFGATSLQYKHKYRTYHPNFEKPDESNPVNLVNPVKKGALE